MDIKKITLFIIFIILITTNIFAETIETKSFEELNFNTMIVKKNTEICFENKFDELKTKTDSKYYLTLIIENYVKTTKDLNINIYLNDKFEKNIQNNKILKENIIKLKNISNIKENNLKICISNNYIPELIISKKSKIGTYNLAEILETNFYQITPEKGYINDLIPVEIFIKNTGSGKIFVNLYNAYETYLKNSNLDNVSGQTTYFGEIYPGEIKSIKYFIKTDNSKTYLTPRAYVEYIDEFDKKKTIYTNQNIINLSENQEKIKAIIDISKNSTQNNTLSGNLIIINQSLENIKNIYIIPEYEEYITLEKEEIKQINKKDIIEIPFKINTPEIKEYSLLFKINYEDQEKIKQTTTEKIKINTEPENTKILTITSILIALTIILFIWVFKF
ncbi:MAG: hypothetical protein PHR26_01035 [Candidatus ainarchaeum sp.]|nr:hypothetical protein [Candidatus ainarchaeum sp.]MDD3975852.1 hypothetical protein [Candidatus ainarchaeum sp.]